MSERLYRLLLRLYPRAFRERYAEEMARVFLDRLAHERTAQVWLDVLADAVVSIPRQHWLREPHPFYPASAAPLRAINVVFMQARCVTMLAGGVTGIALFVAYIGGVSSLAQPVFWLPALAILSLWAVTSI